MHILGAYVHICVRYEVSVIKPVARRTVHRWWQWWWCHTMDNSWLHRLISYQQMSQHIKSFVLIWWYYFQGIIFLVLIVWYPTHKTTLLLKLQFGIMTYLFCNSHVIPTWFQVSHRAVHIFYKWRPNIKCCLPSLGQKQTKHLRICSILGPSTCIL